MTYTDNLGTWDTAGEATVTNNWQILPGEIYGETLRFTYNLDWDEWTREIDLRAYIVGRFYYPVGDTIEVTPQFRLYPKQLKELREFSILSSFVEQGILIRSLGVKAVRLNSKFYFSNAPIINMSLKVDYLL